MNWKTKARIQSLVARIPNWLSYPLYFQLQRRFGAMQPRRIDPTSRMQVGLEVCEQIVAAGGSPTGATFFEVGTGWRLNLPIACWLLGAKRFVTVDLNRYLRIQLVREDIHFLQTHRDAIAAMFEERLPELFDRRRFDTLLRVKQTDATSFCQAIGVEYLAPADAANTPLPSRSIDYHVSCNVLEHIPRDVLLAILTEANRIVRPDGRLVHRVDHSDHFSHTDPNISAIHFLKYSDADWGAWADNRYAYVNRLREDDYLQLFSEAGQQLDLVDSAPDPRLLAMLVAGYSLDGRFTGKSHDTLARTHSLFVARPASASATRAA